MGSQALAVYERARTAATPVEMRAELDAFVQAADNWTRSAIVAAATEHAADYVGHAFDHARPEALTEFVSAVVPSALPASAARLITVAAAGRPQAAALKAAVAQGIARMEGGTLTLDAATTKALQQLLDDPATAPAAVAIVAKWNTGGTLGENASRRAGELLPELRNAATTDERRGDIAASLLAVPDRRADVLSAIGSMLADPGVSEPLKARLITTLGESPGRDAASVMVTAAARTKSPTLVDQILKRPDAALALLAALKEGGITLAAIGPANAARLRTHPDRTVAAEAAALLDKLSASAKAKDELIAQLAPEVEKPGDSVKGKVLFTAACATCHKLGELGKSEVGPPLNGMGARPRVELLTSVLDPNREVDPSFWQWNVTTKRGETLVGIIASENASGLTLRSASGDVVLRNEDIATRENTHRSFMPEGLETLGAEGLRDILTFIAEASPGTGGGQDAAKPPANAAGPKEGGKNDAPLPPSKPIGWAPGKLKVLIVAGGSSHDFGRFFGETDGNTLGAAGFSVNYTEDRDQAAAEIARADVAVVSVNRQFFDTPAYRKALLDFAAAGKGLVMLHPGTWYGFPDWPELNATIVGGGARGHDRIAKFSVKAVKPEHPVMKGVPASFDVEDELYYLNAEADKIPPGTVPIDVLAETSPSVKFKSPHPAVWVARHPTARIVGITLGHDQRVHDLPAFKTLLANAVRWVGRAEAAK
jgi:putative heme-binding domain-containing protein